MAMENIFGMTGQCTRASGSKTRSMEEEYTFGQMAENTMVNGKITICTAKVSTPGKMEECMRETMKTIENMVTVFTLGMMANSTKDGGRMESSTERVSTEKMDVIEEEFGRMAKELSGLMMLNGMK
jgi:hypothetical protein